jgi:alcohol dehydrogenase, propanol-preferring
MEVGSTYRAVHAVSRGRLELTEKTMQAPGPGKVRLRVEACGVCHSDSGTVEALFPIEWPRVPGHEVVGRIDALGSGVQGRLVGQRVGVGFVGGACGYCEFCRSGDLVSCRNQEYTGIHHDGGYAEVMIAKASGLVSIPDDLSSVDAAPLLCAGLTTFSALRNAPAKAGELVAVVGIGGLGHLGVQYARRMGFEVVAIARGADMPACAEEYGHPCAPVGTVNYPEHTGNMSHALQGPQPHRRIGNVSPTARSRRICDQAHTGRASMLIMRMVKQGVLSLEVGRRVEDCERAKTP